MDKNLHINNTWDIALQHGHSAFRILKIVKDIESEYRLNKSQLDNLEFGRSEYLNTIGQNHYLMSDHFKMCSASIILFQAMMEAIINDSIEKESALSNIENDIVVANDSFNFKNKWKYSLKHLGQDPQEFLNYFSEIYDKYRNDLIHPKNEGIDVLSKMTYQIIFKGFKKGWTAYSQLYDGLGHPHDEDSWKIICRTYGLIKN